MISGLIIYNKIDRDKNQWFIDRCLSLLNNSEFSLSFLDEDLLEDYLKNHHADFAIYRSRNHELVSKMEKLGIKVFNNSLTNKTANDKYETYQCLTKLGIPCLESSLDIIDISSFPIVMKSVSGHGGQEVYLINSIDEQKEMLKKSQTKFIYQKYIKNSGDLRVYLLGEKLVSAVLRQNDNDFRSNYSLGGHVSIYQPEIEIIEMAKKVACFLRSDFIGVDFIKDENAWKINEIEDPVGSRMLYQVSNIDIVSLFCAYIANYLKAK